jgi:hypothetical protein
VLSDKVRTGVLQATQGHNIVVMGRENIAILAKDMGLDLTCIEGACEVETGRNIGAILVVSGSVTQMGGAWICTLKIHQTQTGAILATGDIVAETPSGLHNDIPGLVAQLMKSGVGSFIPLAKMHDLNKRWIGKWVVQHVAPQDNKVGVEFSLDLMERGLRNEQRVLGGTLKSRRYYDVALGERPKHDNYEQGEIHTRSCSGKPKYAPHGQVLILYEDLKGQPMSGSHCATLRITGTLCFMDDLPVTCPNSCTRHAEKRSKSDRAAKVKAAVAAAQTKAIQSWTDLTRSYKLELCTQRPQAQRLRCTEGVQQWLNWAYKLFVTLPAGEARIPTECGERIVRYPEEKRKVTVAGIAKAEALLSRLQTGDVVEQQSSLKDRRDQLRLSVGGWHRCAVNQLGTVKCWGFNRDGQLSASGHSAGENPGPLSTPGPFVSVSAGDRHTCALYKSGKVRCWGSNTNGQAKSPSGLFKGIDSSGVTNCGVLQSGLVKCWGGDGFQGPIWPDPPSATIFKSVHGGDLHYCGLKPTGTLMCWSWDASIKGSGGHGMGENRRPLYFSPPGKFKNVSLGEYYRTCGITTEDTVKCWEHPFEGGRAEFFPGPQGIFKSIDAGGSRFCGVRVTGTIECWPMAKGAVPPPSGNFTSVSMSGGSICGTLTSGKVKCGAPGWRGSTPPANLLIFRD